MADLLAPSPAFLAFQQQVANPQFGAPAPPVAPAQVAFQQPVVAAPPQMYPQTIPPWLLPGYDPPGRDENEGLEEPPGLTASSIRAMRGGDVSNKFQDALTAAEFGRGIYSITEPTSVNKPTGTRVAGSLLGAGLNVAAPFLGTAVTEAIRSKALSDAKMLGSELDYRNYITGAYPQGAGVVDPLTDVIWNDPTVPTAVTQVAAQIDNQQIASLLGDPRSYAGEEGGMRYDVRDEPFMGDPGNIRGDVFGSYGPGL